MSSSKKYFSILSLNVQSLNAKFNELEAFINELYIAQFKFNVICLQECWLTNESDASTMQLHGYKCIAQGKHSSERGGLIMYVDDCFQYDIILNINTYEHWEGQVVCVNGDLLSKDIIIGNIYRPPRMTREHTNTFCEEFTHLLQSLENSNKNIYLAGDYNLNLLKINENVICSDFFDVLTAHSYFPKITFPTRLTDRNGTLIDNFFCNFDQLTKQTIAGILLNKISDHQPYFLLSPVGKIKSQTSKFINIYTSTEELALNITDELIKSDLWNNLNHNLNTNPNLTYNIIHDTLIAVKIKHLSCRVVKFNKYKHKKSKWITTGILRSIRFRDRIYKRIKLTAPQSIEHAMLTINLKTYNRILKICMRTAKQQYYAAMFTKCKSDIRRTWLTINKVLSRNSGNRSLPNTLNIDNLVSTDNLDMANEFNTFFTNIGPNLANNINYIGDKTYNDYLINNPNNIFEFDETDEVTIQNIIDQLSIKNSSGHDGISTKLLKLIAPVSIKPLSLLVNQVLKTGIFPEKLKLAKVIPIYKKGDKSIVNNYRPISLLPVISKVLEKIIANQLSTHFESNHLFSNSQYGFRAAHSTEYAALELVDKIITIMDNNNIPISIFIDMSKAFDTIDHNILLAKLKHYGLDGIPLNLCKCYLTNRTQYVDINSTKSNILPITTGVPQGSILGPLLFIIYVNDLSNSSQVFDFISYADDTTLLSTLGNLNTTAQLNVELANVNEWLEINKLSLNKDKCKYMVFHMPQKRFIAPRPQINTTIIEKVNEFNFLGLILDTHLN